MLKSIAIFSTTLALTLNFAMAQMEPVKPDTILVQDMNRIWQDDRSNILTFSDTGIPLQEEPDSVIGIEDDFSKREEGHARPFSQHGILLWIIKPFFY